MPKNSPSEVEQVPAAHSQFFSSGLIYGLSVLIGVATWWMWRHVRDDPSFSYRDFKERFFSSAPSVPREEVDLISLEELEEFGRKVPLFKPRRPVQDTLSQQGDADAGLTVEDVSDDNQNTVAEFVKPFELTPQQQYGEVMVAKVRSIIERYGKKGVDQSSLARGIVTEAAAQAYDPLFVAAVIKTESAFHTDAKSSVGARGLMQIMPGTKSYIETFDALEGVPRGSLNEPGYNLNLGITYLKYLEKMFDGNRVLTLIAYNWGPGHVTKTVRGEKKGVPRPVVNYALKILSDHQRWRQDVHRSTGG